MMVKSQKYAKHSSDAVFRPALTPLEAAMLPAAVRPDTGALKHMKRETARCFCRKEQACAQRTKIWVR